MVRAGRHPRRNPLDFVRRRRRRGARRRHPGDWCRSSPRGRRPSLPLWLAVARGLALVEEDGPDSWEGRPLSVDRANTKGFRTEAKIASATSGEADGSPHPSPSPSPSPTLGTRRPGSDPRRRDAGGFDHEDGAEQKPKPSARGTRALAATIAGLPFAVLGALVVVYLAWWGIEMGARIPGGDGLLLGIVASVAVSLAATLIGSWGGTRRR